jgi:Tol biopolymer transport system component
MRDSGVGLWRVLVAVLLVVSGALVNHSVAEPVTAATGNQQRIVYLDRNNNAWTARTDGSDARQLTTSGGFGNVQWSHDGTRILATGPYEGGTGVFLMSHQSGFELRSLSRGRAPAWSPDSARFAFIEHNDVHIFDRNGGYQRTVQANADALRWSPDGTKIGFTRIVADPYETGCHIRELGWIDANSGQTHTITQTIGKFAWAGDADQLLYVSASDGSVRSHSISGGSSTWLSSRTANPCNGPFFTTPDGKNLLFLHYRGSARDLVSINMDNNQQRVYPDVPVSFPSNTLPSAYVSVDHSSRYVTLARSYPTDIFRLDLETGNIDSIISGDWRQVIGFSPDGRYYSLLHVPGGRPVEMTIRDLHLGETLLEDVGWMAWQPSAVNKSASLAWNRTWAREDRPVAAGESRTWLWGPGHFDVRVEEYDEAPDGFRAVRYLDKSRMEITNPQGDRGSRWYVTNGLLVVELITGRLQVGDDRFVERAPANVPVAGDANDPHGPTYATLGSVLNAPPLEVGQEVRATINRNGQIGADGPGGVTAAHYVPQTNHTVASVFWDYLNSTGPVWDGNRIVNGRLFDPTFFATGYPITEAYWSTVQVSGEPKQVLIQCFERRCLTFTPDNPDGWRVEMGNVGRHYHSWRY